jgi:hypothetical protein
MMIRTILVGAAALASVSFSPRHAEASEAPWCAQIEIDKGTYYWDCQYRSFEDCYRAIFWQAIVAFALQARTTSLDPRSKGKAGNVALARTNRSTFSANAPAATAGLRLF